jgi:hypothetical protein
MTYLLKPCLIICLIIHLPKLKFANSEIKMDKSKTEEKWSRQYENENVNINSNTDISRMFEKWNLSITL